MTNPYQQIVYVKPSDYAPTKEASLEVGIGNLGLEVFFHIIQSEQITLSTDITDHIVEDHTTVQDHITIKPRTFTMRGLISERVFIQPDTIYVDLPKESWDNKLTKLGFLIPPLSSDISSAINKVEAIANKIYGMGMKVYNAITATILGIKDLAMAVRGLSPSIKVDQTHQRWAKGRLQKSIIDILDYARVNRVPVKINTGWDSFYEDMYITDISVNQGDTYQQSELSVTVKQLRFTDVKVTELTQEKYNRYQQQNKDFTDTVTGQSEDNRTVWAREVDRAKN